MGIFGGGAKPISQTEPAIGALRVQTSSYGLPIPLVYGTNRVSGNLIWYGDFISIAHKSQPAAGGKGGGGDFSSTSYTYKVACAFGLCEGPIAGVGTVWQGKNKIADPQTALGFVFFDGSYTQAPWGHLTSYHPAEALNYRGTGYAANASYDLGSDASLPNHNFEVKGRLIYSGIDDANPKDVIVDLLSNVNYGVGFPAENIDTLSAFDEYCRAYGLFISPVWNQQRAAHEMITEALEVLNAEIFWSEDKIKIVPYADEARTANGATYTPNLTPLYDLSDDDFLDESDPVKGTRKSPADMYNQVRIEFDNRANDYNVEPIEAKDQANIELYGLRAYNTISAKFICEKSVAQQCAEMKKQRLLYIANEYTFRLGWRFARLEPMDLVTLTDPGLELDHAPVLITEIEEDEEGGLTIRAEEYPYGVSSAAVYPKQGVNGYAADYNVAPGNVNAPLIFEPPTSLSGAPQLWMAVSGGENYGGCEVWASADNATYARIGEIIGGARQGVLSASLAAGSNPDITNALRVDLTQSRGQLYSGTQQDAADRITLCYVDGELIAYETATLTSLYHYDLNYLVRANYATVNAAHNSGTKFARLDQSIFKHDYEADQIDRTVYLKFLAFNQYSGARQSLADVSAYPYTISGAPVGEVTGLALEQAFTGSVLKVKWDPVSQATSYTVEVWAVDQLRRTVPGLSAPRFEYGAEDATADGGPWRTITIKVKAIAENGASTNPAELVASNPAPASPSGLSATPGPNNVTIKANRPADTDYTGTLVYMSTSSGFTPGAGNLVYDGPDLQIIIGALTAVPYYFRIAHYDSFGTDSLNLSSEISATPTSITGVIDVVNGLPGAGAYLGQVNYLTTDDTLWRWDGVAWISTVDGADILANSITAGKLAVANLSAITASLGEITSGIITLDASSHIKGGQSAYNVGTGFFLGYSGAAYKFSLGVAGGAGLLWDGAALTINGGGTFSGALSAANGTFAGSLSAASGTFAGSLTAGAVNAVNTINLAGQAVTIPVSAYTEGSLSNSSSAEQTIQTAAITSSGAPITIIASFTTIAGDGFGGSTSTEIRLRRNGTQIAYSKIWSTGSEFPFAATYRDTPGAGSVTYTLTVVQNTASGTSTQSRSIILLETKR